MQIQKLKQNIERMNALSELYEQTVDSPAPDEIDKKEAKIKAELARTELLNLSMEVKALLKQIESDAKK